LLLPNVKVGGPVSPGPYGCCAYDVKSWKSPENLLVTCISLLVQNKSVKVYANMTCKYMYA